MKQEDKEQALYAVISQLGSAVTMKAFFHDLCTPAERKAMAERWEVAQHLHRGELSYREIHAHTGVSLTTIARVARFLKNEPHGGYRCALNLNHDLL